ncbi:MAG TPA: FecR domain-containing protein, partial [Gemmatimonadaceae bacterium]|nr:FecR domain-containing protein [Gemmatimonadaceae bacterium]
DVDVEAALRKVHRRMAEPAEAVVAMPSPARRLRIDRIERAAAPASRRWRLIGSLAAAAALVLTAIGIWNARRASGVAPTATAMTWSTAVGERDSVRLADGSTVILGPSSELDVAAGYGASEREVELRGEGYFAVVHDAARPFTVHSGGATIVDVGTTFSVRDDADASVRVAVTSGSVRVSRGSSADSGVVLAARDVVTLAGDAPASVARSAVTAGDTAFTRGALVLRDAPLSQVATELRRWYGIELRVADSATARRRLTATFAGESPEQAMAIIGAALGARLERRGDTVIVR